MILTVGILFVLVYFYPTFIAWKGQAAPAMIIFLINTCLGWTVVGWFAALIMAILNTSFKNFLVVTGMTIGVAFLVLIFGAGIV